LRHHNESNARAAGAYHAAIADARPPEPVRSTMVGPSNELADQRPGLRIVLQCYLAAAVIRPLSGSRRAAVIFRWTRVVISTRK
jgi:hypothetical protein